MNRNHLSQLISDLAVLVKTGEKRLINNHQERTTQYANLPQ